MTEVVYLSSNGGCAGSPYRYFFTLLDTCIPFSDHRRFVSFSPSSNTFNSSFYYSVIAGGCLGTPSFTPTKPHNQCTQNFFGDRINTIKTNEIDLYSTVYHSSPVYSLHTGTCTSPSKPSIPASPSPHIFQYQYTNGSVCIPYENGSARQTCNTTHFFISHYSTTDCTGIVSHKSEETTIECINYGNGASFTMYCEQHIRRVPGPILTIGQNGNPSPLISTPYSPNVPSESSSATYLSFGYLCVLMCTLFCI